MQRQVSFSQAEYAGKKKQSTTGHVLGRDGAGGALGASGRSSAAVPSEGRARPAADWTGADAAALFCAAMVRAG